MVDVDDGVLELVVDEAEVVEVVADVDVVEVLDGVEVVDEDLTVVDVVEPDAG